MVSDDNFWEQYRTRLEAEAKPAGICISNTVFDMINRKIMVSFEDAGELKLKT